MRAEIDLGVEEFDEERAKGVGLGQTRDGVAELEVIENVLHVRRKAVEIGFKVRLELLRIRARFEVGEGKLRGVVECLTGRIAQRGPLFGDARPIEQFLGFENGCLGRHQHGVESPQHAHGQNDIAVLAADKQVAKHVIRDSPDEGDDLVVRSLVHLAQALSVRF